MAEDKQLWLELRQFRRQLVNRRRGRYADAA